MPFKPLVQFDFVAFRNWYGGGIGRDIVPKVLDEQYLFWCA
jgi:hypothetical protein